MNHTVKIKRTKSKASIGKYHRTFDVIIETLPDSVITNCSSSVLAELVDANYYLTQRTKAIAERDAIEDGAIWDDKKNVMREIM